MQIRNLNNTGLSLLEILVAGVIFMISVAGIFATLNAVRGPVVNKENQLAAAVFGKQVLQALYSNVTSTQYSYYGGCTPGNGSGTSGSPCTDFTLSVGVHLTAMPAGLSWPSGFSAVNNGIAYTVYCADTGLSNDPTCQANPSTAHGVTLNINWPTFS